MCEIPPAEVMMVAAEMIGLNRNIGRYMLARSAVLEVDLDTHRWVQEILR